MLEEIKSLEQKARQLEPREEQRNAQIDQVVKYSQRFLRGLQESKAYNASDPVGNSTEKWWPEDPMPMNEIIALVENEIDAPGINTTSGRHFGYIPGGGLFSSALGDYLASVSNRYVGISFASPGGVRLEHLLVRWMCKLVGYGPAQSGGTLTSGGSIANLTAIINARDASGLKAKDFSKAVIYCTAQTHHCIPKALRNAGMGESVIRTIRMNDFKMDVEVLERQILLDKEEGLAPFLVAASAGTTDTGAIDPLEPIGQIARKYQLWFHVDAAYGGAFLLIAKGKKLLKGIEQADSVIIDPHKGLFVPYGSGAVLVKDQRSLFNSFSEYANYMQDAFYAKEEVSPADLSPELTRPFRGLRLWLPLKLYGLAPFRAALMEKMLLCQYFYQQIAQWPGIEVGPEPELSVTFFRFVPQDQEANAFNQQLILEIQNDGRIFLSSTTIDGKFYLRMAVVSYRSHLADVQLALTIVKEKIGLLTPA